MEYSTNNFYYYGKNVKLNNNFYTSIPKRIYIGDNTVISEGVGLVVSKEYCNIKNEINLKIENHVFLNSRVRVESANYVEIRRYVIVGPDVYVSDMCHEYKIPQIPIKLQGFINVNENKVIIKDGAWIGAGARVVGNLTVGYGAVVGANAVVTKDVPDHSVAVGVPARVVKIYDYSKNIWVNVKNNSKLLLKILNSRGVFAGYDTDFIDKKLKYEQDIDEIVNLSGKLMKVIEDIMRLIEQEKYTESKNLLIDLSNLLDTIQSSIKGLLKKEELEEMKDIFIVLNKNLNGIIVMYETNNYSNSKEFFNNNFVIAIQNLNHKLLEYKNI
ncbi:acyltransferase [Clostridium estertheticum]|uniref:Acyltransferase n=1 Tax=Clostridium estertheticum TaxID=238834 RepID=A0A7Y3WRJ3_9CLOT|nr:acyltransferase [Clostridium estertheticum]NNU76047.1 acyltransferase [Clostridium estertheticum]WBL46370.1 acyltransferase [Clostridium estertheticum]